MIDRPTAAVASFRAAVRHPLRHPLVRLGLLGSGLLALLLPGLPAGAEVRAAGGGQSLGTRVNGVAGGGCSAGLCEVSGGTRANRNLFHRFSRFDTRGEISGVTIRNGTARNVIVGVTDPLGSFIDKPVSLARSGNLAWLSPGGLAISGAGGFREVARLNLSTGTGLRLGSGVFDALSSTASQAAALTDAPVWGRTGVVNDPASLAALGLTTNGNLSLSDGTLTVDQSLLLDAQGGNVLLQAAGLEIPSGELSAQGRTIQIADSILDVSASSSGAGGAINLRAADDLWLKSSSLLASGAGEVGVGGSVLVIGSQTLAEGVRIVADGVAGGGRINFGGGFQGLEIGGANSLFTTVDSTSIFSANALSRGDGGEVVVWSDRDTFFQGKVEVRGGSLSGDGGLIEVSGKERLGFNGLVDASAPMGVVGTLLLDPKDLYIGNSTTYSSSTPSLLLNQCSLSSPPLCSSVSSAVDAFVDNGAVVIALSSADLTLVADQNVYLLPGSDILAPTALGKLTLSSSNGSIFLNSNIDVGSAVTSAGGAGVDLIAPSGIIRNNQVNIATYPSPTTFGSSVYTPITVTAGEGGIGLVGNVDFQSANLLTPAASIPSGATSSPGSIIWGGSSFSFVGGNIDAGSSSGSSQNGPPLIDIGQSSNVLGQSISISGGALVRNWGGEVKIGGGSSAITINGLATIRSDTATYVDPTPTPFSASYSAPVYIGANPSGPAFPGAATVSLTNATLTSNQGGVKVGVNSTSQVLSAFTDVNISQSSLEVFGSSISISGAYVDASSGGSISIGNGSTSVVSLTDGFYGYPVGSPLSVFVAQGSSVGLQNVTADPLFNVVINPSPSPSPGPGPSPDPTPIPPPDPAPIPPPDPTPIPPPDPTPTPPPDPTPPPPSPTPSDISSAVQEPVIGSVLNQPILQPSTTQISVSGSESSFGTSLTVSSSPQLEASSDLGSGLTTTAASFETSDPLTAETPVASQPATAGEPVPAQVVASVATTDDQQKDQKDQSAAQASEGQSPEANSLAALTGAEAVQQGQPAPLAPSGAASLSSTGSAQSSPVPINVGGLQSSGRQAQPMATAQVSDSNQQSDARASEINRALNTEVAPADEAQQRAALEASQRPPQSGLSSSGQGANRGAPANTVGGIGPGSGAGQGLGPGSVAQPGVRP